MLASVMPPTPTPPPRRAAADVVANGSGPNSAQQKKIVQVVDPSARKGNLQSNFGRAPSPAQDLGLRKLQDWFTLQEHLMDRQQRHCTRASQRVILHPRRLSPRSWF